MVTVNMYSLPDLSNLAVCVMGKISLALILETTYDYPTGVALLCVLECV
jgi:MFS-type transporter involved in bile tolerance (Atg22 family)